MKKSIIIFTALMGLILTGCQKESVTSPIDSSDPELPTSGNETPAWSVDTNYDYSSSMTAVVKVDLTITYPSIGDEWQLTPYDLVGAFCGERCVGVAEPTDSLFFVYITPPDAENTEPITLRYYSRLLKNIFYSDDTFPFKNGEQQGTVTDPLRPRFRTAE